MTRRTYCDCWPLHYYGNLWVVVVWCPLRISRPSLKEDKGCRLDIIQKGVRIVSCNRFDCRWSCEAVISLPIHPRRRFTYFDCPHIKFVDNVIAEGDDRPKVSSHGCCGSTMQSTAQLCVSWWCGNYIVCKSPANCEWHSNLHVVQSLGLLSRTFWKEYDLHRFRDWITFCVEGGGGYFAPLLGLLRPHLNTNHTSGDGSNGPSGGLGWKVNFIDCC